MSTLAPTGTFTKTKPGGNRASPTSEYSTLLNEMRDAGLLKRRTGFYVGMFAALIGALAGTGYGIYALRGSWLELLMAGALGLILTQFAFLAHEASHRQIFESGKANDLAGRTLANLFVGISYSWWMTKHSRHHANPNVEGKDTDIERDFVSFVKEDAAKATGIYGWATRHQGYLFFPILSMSSPRRVPSSCVHPRLCARHWAEKRLRPKGHVVISRPGKGRANVHRCTDVAGHRRFDCLGGFGSLSSRRSGHT